MSAADHPSQRVDQHRIQHLDGMRGLAILIVIIYHAYVRWPEYLPYVAQTKDFLLIKYDFLGVQLFFMISGFVIFMSLDKSRNIFSFLGKRWLRLFPVMLIASIFIYLTAPFFFERPLGIPKPIDLIPGLSFIHPQIISIIAQQQVHGLEGVFWSLYVEVIFYCFAGIVYFYLGRNYLLKALYLAFLGFFILSIINLYHPIDLIIDSLDALGFIYYGWFFAGCFMYEKLSHRVNKLDYFLLISITVLTLSLSYLSYRDLVELIFTLAIMIFFFISFKYESIKKLLKTRLLMFYGLISYPLYLIHENILVSFTIKLLQTSDLTPQLLPIIPIVILSILAYLITLLEPKLRSLLIKCLQFDYKKESIKSS